MENYFEKIQKYLHNGCAEEMENRIERLRKYIDEILLNMKDTQERRCGYLHLYGVSQTCAFIALKRNQDVELATMVGMLHDLHSYKAMNTENHAEHGAVLARQILGELSMTTENEIDLICSAIRNHSSKATTHSAFDEVNQWFQHVCDLRNNHVTLEETKKDDYSGIPLPPRSTTFGCFFFEFSR